jgi:hypothetical protein
LIKVRKITIRKRHKISLSQARIRRKLYPTAERIALATFEIAAAEVTFGLKVADHRLDGGASS